MTDDMMSLRTLVEKIADADFLREMIGVATERLMALEFGEQEERFHLGGRTWMNNGCSPPVSSDLIGDREARTLMLRLLGFIKQSHGKVFQRDFRSAVGLD